MTLDKNILAQAEQLLQAHDADLNKLKQNAGAGIAQAFMGLEFQNTLMKNTYRELAVFKMLEDVWDSQDFTEADIQEVKDTLVKVRAQGREDLSKLLTPEQQSQLDENLDKTLAEMAQTTVTERQQ